MSTEDESNRDQSEDLNEESGSILMSLISQLSYGMDLSRVTLPTFVLEPRSLLVKYIYIYTYIYYI